MKAVIFAGGLGTRFSEQTQYMPKPMIEIGGKPILWHIMKIYAAHDIKEFIICCGYKQYVIKEYFANYFRHNTDMTVNLTNKVKVIYMYPVASRENVSEINSIIMPSGMCVSRIFRKSRKRVL